MLTLPTVNPIQTLAAAGCTLANTMGQGFLALYQATGCNPCKECNLANGCKAKAKWYRNQTTPPPASHTQLVKGVWAGKTIRQIAKEQGISLNEARRRKQAGMYLA